MEALQDVLNCLVLSEVVYKVVDIGEVAAASTIEQLQQEFPPGLVSVERLQWSLPHVSHRYLVAEGGDALYVAFMGTKARRDLLTNANVVLEPLWPADACIDGAPVPSVHRGFLQRARGIPLASLARHAVQQGKRLVFCGHSLGAAVATICTLDLLSGLPADRPQPRVSCIAFAGPAVGNAALAELVQRRGWERHLSNYMLPEDRISRWFSLVQPQGAPSTAADSSIQCAPDTSNGPQHAATQAADRTLEQSSSYALPRTLPRLRLRRALLAHALLESGVAANPLAATIPAAASPAPRLQVSTLQGSWELAEWDIAHAVGSSELSAQSPQLSAGILPRQQPSMHTMPHQLPGSPPKRQRLGLRFRTNNVVPFAALPRRAASQGAERPLPGFLPRLRGLAGRPEPAHEQDACQGEVGPSASRAISADAACSTAEPKGSMQTTSAPALGPAVELPAAPSQVQQAKECEHPSAEGQTARARFNLAHAALRAIKKDRWLVHHYKPLGKQFFLRPRSAVSSADRLDMTWDAEPLGSLDGSSIVVTGSIDDAALTEAQRRQRKQLLWMHRLPSYRSRIKQILAAVQPDLTDDPRASGCQHSVQEAKRSSGTGSRASPLSSLVAPMMRPQHAFLRAALDGPAEAASQLSQVGGANLAGMGSDLAGVSASLTGVGGRTTSRLPVWPWPIAPRRDANADEVLHVEVVVTGWGLDACSSAEVQAFGDTWLDTQVLHWPVPLGIDTGRRQGPRSWRALRQAAEAVRERRSGAGPNELVLRVAFPTWVLCALDFPALPSFSPDSPSSRPPLVVHLRSDFALAEVALDLGHGRQMGWAHRPLQAAGELLDRWASRGPCAC